MRKTAFRSLIVSGIILGVLLPLLPPSVSAVGSSWLFPSLIPDSLSFRAWEYIAEPGHKVLQATANSIVIALLTTLLSLLVGVPAGKALGQLKFRGKGLVEMIILAPAIIPSMAVTMGLQIIFIRLGLTETLFGVVLVHLIPCIPYMTVSMSGVFANYDEEYDQQARSLGANPFQTFFLVTLPAVFPGIMVGSMFSFLISWGQYVLTIIIGGGRIITLPILLFSFAGSGDHSLTGALILVYLLPSFLILAVTGKYLSGSHAGGFFSS